MSARFATINDDNRVQTDFVADAYPIRANYYSQWVRAGRDASNDGLFQVVCVPYAAPAGTLGALLSNIDAVTGQPLAGKLQWFLNYIKGDAAASTSNPLVIYLLDVVEIAESKPTLYFRWDDATKDHRAVSSHMRNGTKFGGGVLARPLPSTFGIIPAFVGSDLTGNTFSCRRYKPDNFFLHDQLLARYICSRLTKPPRNNQTKILARKPVNPIL